MTKPKRHHYRPELYLKGFSAKGTGKSEQAYVLDKSTNKVLIMSIADLCVESAFFSFDEKGLSIENKLRLEHSLSEIETKVEPVLTMIRKKKTLASISPQDFSFLIKWMGWLFIAQPVNKHILNSILQKHLNFSFVKFTNSAILNFF